MTEYTTHCTECGTPLTDDEVAYSETGSLVSEPVDLCKYCSTLHGGNVSLDDFLDEVNFLNEDWDE